MRGILKSNHERLQDFLREIKGMNGHSDHKLVELGDELQALFQDYEQKITEIKDLILVYDKKQRSIKNEIKRVKKNGFAFVKG